MGWVGGALLPYTYTNRSSLLSRVPMEAPPTQSPWGPCEWDSAGDGMVKWMPAALDGIARTRGPAPLAGVR